MEGYPDGTFKPEKYVTEAEFAAILARYVTNTDKQKSLKGVQVNTGHSQSTMSFVSGSCLCMDTIVILAKMLLYSGAM